MSPEHAKYFLISYFVILVIYAVFDLKYDFLNVRSQKKINHKICLETELKAETVLETR